MSFQLKAVNTLTKLRTYPYRKHHKSISSVAKPTNTDYSPDGFYFKRIPIANANVEILRAKSGDNGRIILQFHGGGHAQGLSDVYRKVAENLVHQTNCAVYSIDYPPNPEYIYPSLHDLCDYICVQLQRSIDFSKVIMIGDGFGANLMLSTCKRLQDGGYTMPRALVSISGFLDLSASGESYVTNCYRDPMYSLPKTQKFEKYGEYVRRKSSYIGRYDPQNPYLSPAYLDYYQFPPILIQTGALELCMSDSIMLKTQYVRANRSAKLSIYEDMGHDYAYMYPNLPESKKAWEEVYAFIKKYKNYRYGD